MLARKPKVSVVFCQQYHSSAQSMALVALGRTASRVSQGRLGSASSLVGLQSSRGGTQVNLGDSPTASSCLIMTEVGE